MGVIIVTVPEMMIFVPEKKKLNLQVLIFKVLEHQNSSGITENCTRFLFNLIVK
jgi:hypothetical protein